MIWSLVGLTAAHAAPVGLGLALGSPTGVTAAVFVSDHADLDFLVGEGWHDNGWRDDELFVSADYDVHLVDLAKGPDARLDFYLGGGVNVWLLRDIGSDLGLEMPVGLSLNFTRAPVELFVELAPTFVVTDYTWFDMGGSLGGRYYFGRK